MNVGADGCRADDEARSEPTPAPEPAGPVEPPRQPRHRAALGQVSTVAAKLGALARQACDRVAAASPMTILVLLLGVLTALSMVAALSSESSLGVTSTVLFVPALSAALGALAMRHVLIRADGPTAREDARDDTTEMRQLQRTLDYVDAKLDAALTQFGTDRHNHAVVAMFQAKAATELYRESTGSLQHDAPETRYALADFLTPAARQAAGRLERPAGLSLI